MANIAEHLLKYKQKAVICFERCMKMQESIAHSMLNVVPINTSIVESFLKRFEDTVKVQKMFFFKIAANESLGNFVQDGEYYFYLECRLGEQIVARYLWVFKETLQVPLDFGRLLICQLCGFGSVNWKECLRSEAELREEVDDLRKIFAIK